MPLSNVLLETCKRFYNCYDPSCFFPDARDFANVTVLLTDCSVLKNSSCYFSVKKQIKKDADFVFAHMRIQLVSTEFSAASKP